MRPILCIILFSIATSQLTVAQEIQETQIKSVFFGGGSYYIDDEQVKEITDFLLLHPNIEQYSITIHSHTDNIGSMEYNQWLSQMRSESVLYQLIQNNIPIEHIRVADFGESNPIFENNSWQGRIRNRRVDIIIEPLTL